MLMKDDVGWSNDGSGRVELWVGGGVGEGAVMNTVAAPDMMLCRAKDECAHCDCMMMSER